MQKKRILCTSAALLAAISLIMPNQGYAKAKKPVLSKKKLTMSVGESKTLKVKNTKKKVKWSSGKKSVASVSKKGRVKAKKKGTAVITACTDPQMLDQKSNDWRSIFLWLNIVLNLKRK